MAVIQIKEDDEMKILSTLASAAFAVVALTSGASHAADGFQDQIQETRAAMNSTITDRSDRDAAVISLNAAEGLYRAGDEAKAQQFLNFARGELGFPVTPVHTAVPVVALSNGVTAQAAQDNGIIGLRPEAH